MSHSPPLISLAIFRSSQVSEIPSIHPLSPFLALSQLLRQSFKLIDVKPASRRFGYDDTRSIQTDISRTRGSLFVGSFTAPTFTDPSYLSVADLKLGKLQTKQLFRGFVASGEKKGFPCFQYEREKCSARYRRKNKPSTFTQRQCRH